MDPIRTLVDPAQPLTWLWGSVMVAAVATWLGWALQAGQMPARGWRGWPGLGPLGWLAKSLYLLLPPMLAWQGGALSPFLMGLAELDWVQSLTTGFPLLVLVCGITLFSWLVYRRSWQQRSSSASGWWRAPIDAALLQWHWAFYRALAAGFLALSPLAPAILKADPIYWGSWLGAIAVGLEAALNPFNWRTAGDLGRTALLVRSAALAVATTGIFTVTRNLWLCLACHLIVEVAIARWFPLPSADASGTAA